MSRSSEFLIQAGPGAVVLTGTTFWVNALVRAAQSSITPDGKPSRWGHALLVGKKRPDGEIAIFESDITVSRSGLKNGAQENKLSRYYDDKKNVALCRIDFHLTPPEVDLVLAEAQQRVAAGIEYPVLEPLGTFWAFITKTFRKPNPLDLDKASYCSAFVNNCFAPVGHLVPAAVVHPTNVSPEHIFQTRVRSPESQVLGL